MTPAQAAGAENSAWTVAEGGIQIRILPANELPRYSVVVPPEWDYDAIPGQTYQIQKSTNLFDWTVVQQVMPTNGQFAFTNFGATSAIGFYRLKSGGP